MPPQAALPADFGFPALKPGAVIVTLHLSGIPKAQRLSKWPSICKKLSGCGIGGPARGVGRAPPVGVSRGGSRGKGFAYIVHVGENRPAYIS